MNKPEYSTKYSKSPKGRARDLRKHSRASDLWIQAKNGLCLDCGKQYHHSLMDLDHRPGEKKELYRFHGGRDCDKQRVLKEIAKCDLVCCLCHRVRTWNRAHPNQQINLNPPLVLGSTRRAGALAGGPADTYND